MRSNLFHPVSNRLLPYSRRSRELLNNMETVLQEGNGLLMVPLGAGGEGNWFS